MTIVMVSSKEQIVLKLFDETAISRNFVGLGSLKIISIKYLPLIAIIISIIIISAVMWLATFNKTLLDLVVYFLNVVNLQ